MPRGGGRGREFHATAAAAYRAGELIRDARTGEVFDYTRKGGVWHREIVAPDEAPEWMMNRAALWNATEAGETRSDAQLARAFMGALPHELNHEQRLELVRGFVRDELTSRGMVADFAIHAPDREGDDRNWHVHILTTMRRIDGDGFAATKARDWNRKELLQDWREAWEEHCNAALEDFDVRIDHRSNAARGIDREPTAHLGHATTQYERGGIPTKRGDLNREIQADNAELDRLVEELAEIDRKIAAVEQRRLEERLAARGPDPYADALARQFGPTPELGQSEARDLAARFGDAPRGVTGEAERDRPGVPREAEPDTAGVSEEFSAAEKGAAPDTSERHTGWRRFVDRVRSFAAHVRGFWQDESSGGQGRGPSPPAARGPDAEPTRQADMELNESDRDAAEPPADAGEQSAPPPAPPPRTWAERLRARAAEIFHNQRGAAPDWTDGFDSGGEADNPPAMDGDDSPGEPGRDGGSEPDFGPGPDEDPDIG